jgi:hypothetical protein
MGEAADAAIRQAARGRRVPKGTACATCGYANPVALEETLQGWRCYDCANAERGRSAVEAHHILPRGVAPETVDLPGNLHRELSEKQRETPGVLIEAARSNPLAMATIILIGLRDFIAIIVTWLSKIINFLRGLLPHLDAELGPDWWTELRPFHAGGSP